MPSEDVNPASFSLQLVRNKRGHSMKTRREEDAARVFWRMADYLIRGE